MSTIKQPSVTSASGVAHYVSLDSLRGLCALAVVFYHLPSSGVITALPFFTNSWLFVDFFFVLSGFVIAASYFDRLVGGFPVSRFMVLRMGRVYPLHFAVLAVMVAVELLKLLGAHGANPPFTGNALPSALLTNLTLTQIFGFHSKVMWNSPAWSIAAEMWAYLVAAIALTVLRGRAVWAAALVAVAMPILLFSIDHQGLDRTYDMGLERCLYGFALGMIAQRLHVRGLMVPSRRAVATAVEVGVVAAVIGLVSLAGHGRATLLFPPLFAITVYVFAGDRGGVSTLLAARIPRLLGALSYSVYMVHIFVIGRVITVAEMAGRIVHLELVRIVDTRVGVVKTLAGPGPMADISSIACVGVVVAVAWFTYRFVEIPARDWSRRLARRVGGPKVTSTDARTPSFQGGAGA
jgi:peptidoglycan/LPS O-acetylase OafA/YrhL